MTGGNTIGRKGKNMNEDFIIGDNVTLGAQSVILGPVSLGDNLVIGALSLVNSNFSNNEVLVGIPAKTLRNIAE